jgi:hypothetical protein
MTGRAEKNFYTLRGEERDVEMRYRPTLEKQAETLQFY